MAKFASNGKVYATLTHVNSEDDDLAHWVAATVPTAAPEGSKENPRGQSRKSADAVGPTAKAAWRKLASSIGCNLEPHDDDTRKALE